MFIRREVFFRPANENRALHIYLPDDYYKSNERYPVMYFFDGHNIFFDHFATFGKSWGLEIFTRFSVPTPMGITMVISVIGML